MASTKISRYDNWNAVVIDDQLTITINLNESEVDVQESKSGKNMTIATTGSHQRVPGTQLKFGLTVYRRK